MTAAPSPAPNRALMQVSLRVHRQMQWRPRCLRKVKVFAQVAQQRRILTHVRPRVSPPVSGRIQPLAASEIILDEFDVRVEAESLVIDEALARIRADNDSRNAQPIAKVIGSGRDDVIVETSPVVPRQENRRAAPLRRLHYGVDQMSDITLAGCDVRLGMLAGLPVRRYPRNRR